MAQDRVQGVLAHLAASPNAAADSVASTHTTAASSSGSIEPGKEISEFTKAVKWNGWGFTDTAFVLTPDKDVKVSGHRYMYSGQLLSHFRPWVEEIVGIDVDQKTPSQPVQQVECPPVTLNRAFLAEIQGQYQLLTVADQERLLHGHGHTAAEIYTLRYGQFDRIPDAVVYPKTEEHVLAIVRAADAHGVVLIPYGGGTSVSYALLCSPDERRMIVSLDTKYMDAIKVDRRTMTAEIEAGAVGRNIEAFLRKQGLTMGHEPDSAEFSSMGGWVATRASGMMKNKYGNIEEIIEHITLVTPRGVVSKSIASPRVSAGPDVHHLALGSEGTLGVVTRAVVKIHAIPECTEFGSILFPDFETGVRCLETVERAGCKPASIRLVDNMQFQFGRSLRGPVASAFRKFTDDIKKFVITKVLNFDPDAMCVCTLQFRGTTEEVAAQRRNLFAIAKDYGAMDAGAENGERGYLLTFMIAYIRDFGLEFGHMSESFETTVPWGRVIETTDAIKRSILDTCAKLEIPGTPFVSCRVTQLYETGACIYTYFGFIFHGLADPVAAFAEVEHAARVTIMEHGGSVSHHHGIGKLRKGFMSKVQTETATGALKAVKAYLDPNDVFASQNLY